MVKITPLTDKNIRTVLAEWEEDIETLSTHNLNRNDAGLPRPQFSRSINEPYYGYPDVWDVSQVTNMEGLFEDKNLQKLFIRPATQFVEYFDKVKINNQLGRPKNSKLPDDWQLQLTKDITSLNDGPVGNVTGWETKKEDETNPIFMITR